MARGASPRQQLAHEKALLLAFACLSFLTPQDVIGQTSADRIASLQREVAAQSERIARLEAEVARLVAALGSPPASQPTGARSVPAPRSAWMTATAWDRIRRGMSERQVISILGPPTSREVNVIDAVILFYRGEVVGSGFVSGNVYVTDEDRVLSINTPVF